MLLKPEFLFPLRSSFSLVDNVLSSLSFVSKALYFFFSLPFKNLNLSVTKVEHVDTHGGSVRVYIQREGSKVDNSVSNFVENEKEFGINDYETYKCTVGYTIARTIVKFDKNFIYLEEIKSNFKLQPNDDKCSEILTYERYKPSIIAKEDNYFSNDDIE